MNDLILTYPAHPLAYGMGGNEQKIILQLLNCQNYGPCDDMFGYTEFEAKKTLVLLQLTSVD